jgi:hypothetical protein
MSKEMGRPEIEIDMEELNKLCSIHCTLSEIAGWFDCSEDTIERRIREKYDRTFAEHRDKKAGKGKISLRRRQYQAAMEGNTTMLVWLGKNWLDQTDKQDIDINQNNPITLMYTNGNKDNQPA